MIRLDVVVWSVTLRNGYDFRRSCVVVTVALHATISSQIGIRV